MQSTQTYTSLDINNPPELTLNLLAFSLSSIYSDILSGLSTALKKVNDGEIPLENLKGGSIHDDRSRSAQEIENKSREISKNLEKTSKELNDKFNQQYNDLSSEAGKIMESLLKKWIYISEVFINKLINNVVKYTDGGNLDKPWNELLPEFNEKVIILAATLNELSRNPELKQAIREIAEAVSISAIELLDALEPSIMEVVDRSIEMGNEIGEKSSRGAMNTMLAFAQALIAEIPFVGGIIDFTLATGKAFNTVSQVFRIITDKGSDIAVKASESVKDQADTFERAQNRITKSVDNARQRLANTQESFSGIGQQVSSGMNPGFNSGMSKNVLRGGSRIKKSLRKFFQPSIKKKFTLKKR